MVLVVSCTVGDGAVVDDRTSVAVAALTCWLVVFVTWMGGTVFFA